MRVNVLAMGAVGLAALLCCCAVTSQAQKPDDDKKPTLAYYGVDACRRCHTTRLNNDPALCRLDEVPVWEKHDKHADAWLVLLEPRAQRMGELLGYAKTEIPIVDSATRKLVIDPATSKPKTQPGYSLIDEPACVRCHGTHVEDPKAKGPTFQPEQGVSCAVCHGPYREWVGAHYNDLDPKNLAWRKTSRTIKESKYGLRDLWDPVKRSELCLSCHLGSSKESKFVTHAMYAAGHPPLPSIEIATFSEEMPRHWDYPIDKPLAIQKYQDFDREQAKFERTQLVILSGLTALRESVQLVAQEAGKLTRRGKKDGEDAEAQVLDFAVFDCYACHHELKPSGWRQRRGYKGKPGRPQLQEWPTALAQASLRALAYPDKELDDLTAPLNRAFDRRPFGDPVTVAAEGKNVVAALDKLIGEIKGKKVDKAVADKLLTALSHLREADYPDYDSARQLAWAFRIVYAETHGRKYDEVKKDGKSLDELIKLSLPATRSQSLEKDLPRAMEARAAYDLDAFKTALRKLTEDWLKRPGK